MPTIIATPYPALGRVLVQTSWADVSAATCVQVRRIVTATGESAPLRTYVWPCSASGEYQHLSGGLAEFWDTEAPLDEPFTYSATAVNASGALVGETIYNPGGLVLSGLPTGYADTPDAAALDITGDIDLRADLTRASWIMPSTYHALVHKWDEPNNQSYGLAVLATGQVRMVWTTGGTSASLIAIDSTAAVAFADGSRHTVRATLDVDNGAGGKTVTFYIGLTVNGPWTVLGTPVTQAATTSIFSGSGVLEVGTYDNGLINGLPVPATIHAVQVRNGINGTIVAQPEFYQQPDGTASFADASGRTWTVRAPARIAHTTTAITATSSSVDLGITDAFWLRDPVRPCNDRQLRLCFDPAAPECTPGEGIFFADLAAESYASNSYAALPTNARRPIAISRARRDANTALTVVTRTFADRDAVLALNEPGSPLQFVAPPAYGIPDRYMSVGQVNVSRGLPDHRFQPRIIQMPYDTVDRPVGPSQGVCGSRVADLCDVYATWGAAEASGLAWSTLVEGTPASLGFRTWGQVNATFADWAAVLANGTWTNARNLP